MLNVNAVNLSTDRQANEDTSFTNRKIAKSYLQKWLKRKTVKDLLQVNVNQKNGLPISNITNIEYSK
jgi:hypothetical protein